MLCDVLVSSVPCPLVDAACNQHNLFGKNFLSLLSLRHEKTNETKLQRHAYSPFPKKKERVLKHGPTLPIFSGWHNDDEPTPRTCLLAHTASRNPPARLDTLQGRIGARGRTQFLLDPTCVHAKTTLSLLHLENTPFPDRAQESKPKHTHIYVLRSTRPLYIYSPTQSTPPPWYGIELTWIGLPVPWTPFKHLRPIEMNRIESNRIDPQSRVSVSLHLPSFSFSPRHAPHPPEASSAE